MNIGGALVNGSVVVAIMPSLRKAILPLISITVVLWFLVLTLPDAIVSVLLTALVFFLAPQVVTSFRTLRDGTISVVSMKALTVSMASNIFWIAYGVVTETYLILLTSGIAMTMILIVMTLELLTQRKTRLRAIV
jgi:hypothetical protein